MPFDSLRDFLSFLEKREDLVRVSRQVDPYLETALVAKKAIEAKAPALIFENVKGSHIPMAVGVYGTRKRACQALDTTEKDFIKEFIKRSDTVAGFEPKIISDGPCKENVITGDDIDLKKFPVAWHATGDKGYYITAGCNITRDPETGIRNASVNRLYVREKNELGLYANLYDTLSIIHKYWARGQACPFAIALGVDPATMISAATHIPLEEDELALAGALRGKPTELVKCETIPLEVPATSEIVIEALIPPNVFKPEAPFVEFTGYYGDERNGPVVQVTAITHRDNPIYQDIITGPPPDENQPMTMSVAADAYKALRRVFPEECIADINMTEGGCTRFHCVVSIKKRYPGQGKQVATALLSVQSIKHVIVVDEDIDVRNHVQVEWAVATRCRAIKDVIFIQDTYGMGLDPTTPTALVSKMGFDATMTLNGDKETSVMINSPCYFPTHRVKLGDYLPGWADREEAGG